MPATSSVPQANAATADPRLQVFVFAMFFIFGGITSLNDVIIPKLKELFTLSFTQAMLVQVCFFMAYAVIGIPGARLVQRIGYMRGAMAGLLREAYHASIASLLGEQAMDERRAIDWPSALVLST